MAGALFAAPRWHAILSSRALLGVRGPDARTFLQGLVTNDMLAVGPSAPAHVAFLNRQGRVLCDAHVLAPAGGGGSYVLDCDRVVSSALHAHLRKFRLRADVELDELDADERVVVALGGPEHVGCELGALRRQLASGAAEGVLVERDPRRAELGYRAIVPASVLQSGALGAEGSRELPASAHEVCRMLLAVAEGGHDFPSAEALPAEANLDVHRAISFTKGCYLGQELTARTHFTGTVRKRALPVVRLLAGSGAPIDAQADWPAGLAHLPAWCKQPAAAHALRALGELPDGPAQISAPGSAVTLASDGASLGKLRSSAHGAFGLAVLRFERLLEEERPTLACASGAGADGGEAAPGPDAIRLQAILPPWVRPAKAPAAGDDK